MGKTSALQVARTGVERAGGAVVFADLSTASSPADMANRVLDAATRALGRSWREFLGELTSRLRIRLELVPDPVTGLAIPTVEARLRSRSEEEQVGSFVSVLDALESMAEDREATLGVILDEFHELHRFGGEAAEWRLRGSIQHHRRIGYVLAGSDDRRPDELVRGALERVVSEEDDRMRVAWDDLTELQQNVLRAVAWNDAGLTAGETLERFGLGHGGTARNSALALAKQGLLRKEENTAGWAFDSPFARAWVVRYALPDAGVRVPIDHLG